MARTILTCRWSDSSASEPSRRRTSLGQGLGFGFGFGFACLQGAPLAMLLTLPYLTAPYHACYTSLYLAVPYSASPYLTYSTLLLLHLPGDAPARLGQLSQCRAATRAGVGLPYSCPTCLSAASAAGSLTCLLARSLTCLLTARLLNRYARGCSPCRPSASPNPDPIPNQAVHYFYAYCSLAPAADRVVRFAVPCGAGGHLAAGLLALQMGPPIQL